jgi:H+/Cl- antiporter ClcA
LKPSTNPLHGLFTWNLREHKVLAAHLLKWLLLGGTVGIAAGSASALFLWSLDRVTTVRQNHLFLLYLLPLAGLLVGSAYARWGKQIAGGNNVLLDQLHQSDGRVPLRMAPFVLGGTLLTHLFGGSAGREGTAVQMGGSLADGLGRLFRLNRADRRLLLTSGIAGGFGSVFGTPMAGTVFALEVTQVGGARYEALAASLAAAVVGDLVVRAWGVGHTHYPSLAGFGLSAVLLGKVALIGLAAGLVARAFAELTHGLKAGYKALIPWEPLRPFAGGILVAAVIIGSGAYEYAGLGTPMILKAFTPGGVAPLAFLWKLILTAMTLGAGFQGGEVTPLFFMGATLGSTLGALLGVPVELAAGTGFVAVFAGAANTPLACLLMGAELFHGGGLPYLGTACIVAFVASGHGGIYASQRVLFPKSAALPVPEQSTLANLRQARAAAQQSPARQGAAD